MRKPSTQASNLLPYLFEPIGERELVTVFHVGPALPDTVDFFSNYRCKLHFIDVFSALPLITAEDAAPTLAHQFEELLQLPPHTRFDICLFWDVFNYLDSAAISAFLGVLRPHLKASTMAHAFSVHNLKAPQSSHVYGISQMDILSYKSRQAALPGYAPHSQMALKELLHGFTVERSVLLPDSRLELLLQAKR